MRTIYQAVGIDIRAEVRGTDSLTRLSLGQACIRRVDEPIGVNITDQQAHLWASNRAAVACHVGHAVQGNGCILGVRKSVEVHRALIGVGPGNNRSCWSGSATATCCCYYVVYKGID